MPPRPRNSIRGRSRIATPIRRERPRVESAASAVTCLTESFDGASWPIGPDQTWEEGHQGSGNNTQVNSDGSNALQRALHVVTSQLTIAAPDDSQLTPPDTYWTGAQGLMRATDTLPGPDMAVSATVVANGPAAPQFLLLARSETDAGEDLPNLTVLGFLAYFEDGGVLINFGWNSGGGLNVSTCANESYGTFAADDLLALTVTGTGMDTVAVAAVNGVTVATSDISDIVTTMAGFGDTVDDLPLGLQAGVGLAVFGDGVGNEWVRANSDDTTILDDWEACPA